MLSFAARSLKLRAILTRVARRIANPTDVAVRFDPFLPRVLDIAVATGLINYLDPGPRFALASSGESLRAVIISEDLFATERVFFASVADSLTEQAIRRIVSGVDF